MQKCIEARIHGYDPLPGYLGAVATRAAFLSLKNFSDLLRFGFMATVFSFMGEVVIYQHEDFLRMFLHFQKKCFDGFQNVFSSGSRQLHYDK